MVKVIGTDDDVKFMVSVGKCMTYQRRRGNNYAIKFYRPTTKRKETLNPYYRLIYDNQKTLWAGLSQGQKDLWNSKGQGFGMTGFELYIQEGWKSNLSSIYGVGRYGQSVYGTAIE